MSNNSNQTVEETDDNLFSLLKGGSSDTSNEKGSKSIFDTLNAENDKKEVIDKNKRSDVDDNDDDDKDKAVDGNKKPDDEKEAIDDDDDGQFSIADYLINSKQNNTNDVIDDGSVQKGGRPSAMSSAIKDLLESEDLVGLEGKEKLTDYSTNDIKELIKANIDNAKEKAHQDLIESLPKEVANLLDYCKSGGRDVKAAVIDTALSMSSDTITPGNGVDPEQIVREYMRLKGIGTDEEIEEEIKDMKEDGSLQKRADKYAPKLKSIYDDRVAKRTQELKEQEEEYKKKQYAYEENIGNFLNKGEINGVKIPRDVHDMLLNGLIKADNASHIDPRYRLRKLPYLLEKYTEAEPRPDLLAEALWLLQDPANYHKEMAKMTANDVNAATLKKLKTEQASNKLGGPSGSSKASEDTKIAKKVKNVFGEYYNVR